MDAQRLDRLTLIRDEVERIREFYEQNPTAMEVGSIERLVETCYESHAGWIRRWNGWEFSVEGGQRAPSLNEFLACVPVGRIPALPRQEVLSRKIYEGPAGEVEYADGHAVRLRPGQAVSKAVLADVRKRYQDDPLAVKAWESFFEKMGQYWSAYLPHRLVLSMRPSHFLHLGHYNDRTCYRTGGAHEHSKFNLAQMSGSVVALLLPSTAELVPEKVEGRMWGFLLGNAAVMTNHYGAYWTTIQPVLKSALWKAVGDNLEELDRPDDDPLSGMADEGIAYVDDTDHWYMSGDVFPVGALRKAIQSLPDRYYPNDDEDHDDGVLYDPEEEFVW